jgi:hypothetical protein
MPGSGESERRYQRGQCRWLIAAAGVVHEEAWKRRAPVFEHPNQPAMCDVLFNLLLKAKPEPNSIKRGLKNHSRIIDDERTVHMQGN